MGGKKILIIEDDACVIKTYENILGKDHNLIFVQKNEKVLEKFETEQPEIVVVDFYAQHGNCFEIIKKIRSASRAVKITMTSSYHLARNESKRIGCNNFCEKPLTTKRVMQIAE